MRNALFFCACRPRRSREGAWIEMEPSDRRTMQTVSRSREGAWIEMVTKNAMPNIVMVAPVRERGLKLQTV